MLVDGHIHVWSPDRERYPFAPGFGAQDPWLPSHTPEDHAAACAGVAGEPVRANLVQMTWYGLDHSYLCDLVADDPVRFAGTGVVPAVCDVSLPPPDRAMTALARRGVRAFRVRSRGTRPGDDAGPDWWRAEGLQRMAACAADEGLVLSFLTGPEDLPDIGRLCESSPRTPVVIDHVGGVRVRDGAVDGRALAALLDLAAYPEVYCKLGPLHALGAEPPPFADVTPLLRSVVNAFGADRCLWESDAGGPILMDDPATTVAASVARIRDADWLEAPQKASILGRTALRLFWHEEAP